ncbi:hypothetical protein L195_g046338, partial [Trifolium pratense]
RFLNLASKLTHDVALKGFKRQTQRLICWFFDEIIGERDGYALCVEVVYEHLLEQCTNCFSIGHSVEKCHKLHQKEMTHGEDRGEKTIYANMVEMSLWTSVIILPETLNPTVGSDPTDLFQQTSRAYSYIRLA